MARFCEICGKGPKTAQKRKLLRGNYNPTGKRWKHPNLQWVRLSSGKRVYACAKCIKGLYKLKMQK
ncbi:MAG: bL28 family ribosomal protein [Candidatus Paceibacteria bacterium]